MSFQAVADSMETESPHRAWDDPEGADPVPAPVGETWINEGARPLHENPPGAGRKGFSHCPSLGSLEAQPNPGNCVQVAY